MATSAGSPTTHLNRQYGIMDSLLYDEQLGNTKYWYRGYTTERPRYWEFKDLLPTTRDINFGGTPTTFEIPLYADKLGPVQLLFQALNINHSGGTFWRYADWLGLAAIQKIVFRFGTNVVQTVYPEKKYYRVVKHLSMEKRLSEEAMLAGNLPVTTRDDNAAIGSNPQGYQEIIFDIPFGFACAPDRYQEIRQLALAPSVDVYWNKISQFVETDAPTGQFHFGTGISDVPIVNVLLKQTDVFLEPDERDANTVAVEKNSGIVRLTEEHQIETNYSLRIPAGFTGVFQYPIQNQKNSLRFIWFFLRPQDNLSQTGGALSRLYQKDQYYMGWKRFRLILGSGEVIFDWQYQKHNSYYLHKKYYNGAPGAPLPFYTFDDNPMDECNAHGAYNFQGLQNPILEIDMGPTPYNNGVGDLAVSVGYSQFNMEQTVRGEVNSQFQ
jgi:hypothetical protein